MFNMTSIGNSSEPHVARKKLAPVARKKLARMTAGPARNFLTPAQYILRARRSKMKKCLQRTSNESGGSGRKEEVLCRTGKEENGDDAMKLDKGMAVQVEH